MRLDDALVTPPASPVARASSRLRFAAEVAAAGAVYLLLACLAYWPVAPLDAGHLSGCACGDPEQQTWFLAWTSYALTHGLNPFLTGYLHVPTGANLAIDTSMPLLGVIGMPVTLLLGPVATFNVLLRLGLAASGASMFGVLRRYVSWWPAAFAGGLLFAFSPYLASQAVRHLFLIFIPLVPLFIPLLDDWLVSRRRSPLRSGMLIGLVAGLQYLISPEILLTSVILAAAGLGYLAAAYRAAVAERVRAFAQGLAAAAGVFVLIAGYGIWLLLAGPDRPRGPLHTLSGLDLYHGDLLSPLFPTGHQLFAPGVLGTIGNSLPAGATLEDGFYLGFPLVLLLGYLIVRCRRVPLVMVAAVIGAVAFILGLGSKLTIDGRVYPVPLPFALFAHLPVLQNLEAARLSLFVQLAAVIVFAVGLDHVRTYGWRPAASERGGAPASGDGPGARGMAGRGAAVAAVGLIALLPLIPNVPIRSRALDTPGFFTSQAVRTVPDKAVALTFPYAMAPHNEAMMWQLASGMRFRLLGGDVFVPGTGGYSTWHPKPPGPPVLSAVLLAGRRPGSPPPPTGATAVAAIRALLARSHVGVVFVDRASRDGKTVAALVQRAARTAPWRKGKLDIWLNVQRDLRQHPG